MVGRVNRGENVSNLSIKVCNLSGGSFNYFYVFVLVVPVVPDVPAVPDVTAGSRCSCLFLFVPDVPACSRCSSCS